MFTFDTIQQVEAAIQHIHSSREIFCIEGICPNGFSLPRGHSIMHFPYLIGRYGAPNSVCTSITESRHISAVKDAYCQSNQNEEMRQVLLTNQRSDKLAAAMADFVGHGMLDRPKTASPAQKAPATPNHPHTNDDSVEDAEDFSLQPNRPRLVRGGEVCEKEIIHPPTGHTVASDIALPNRPSRWTQIPSFFS